MAPTRILIHGSCVSRDIIRVTGERFTTPCYIARQNLISAFSQPTSKPDDWGVSSKFKVRNLAGDFDSDARARIAESASDADIILFDLASERHGVYAVAENSFISATPTQKRSPAVKQLPRKRLIKMGTENHFSLFESAVQQLAEFLRENSLSDRVLVLRFPFTDDSLEGDRLNSTTNATELNAMFEPYYESLEGEEFHLTAPLPRELALTTRDHKWGMSQDHFIDRAYEWWAGQIDAFAEQVRGG